MANNKNHRNWESIIERLNVSKKGEIKVKMGSPGSAQVTRVRLIETYEGLDVYTKGSYIHIGLA